MSNAVSPTKLSSSIVFAKPYLLSREKEYKEFCRWLSFYDQDDNIAADLGGRRQVIIHNTGKVVLSEAAIDKTITFDSFEQFSAYYLASIYII